MDRRVARLFPPSDSWTLEAACDGRDTDLWYSSWIAPSETPMPHGMKQALTICMRCPVRRECLAYALGRPGGEYGIWGGTLQTWRRNKTLANLDELYDSSYGFARARGFTPPKEEVA